MKCVEVYKELYHQEPFDVAFCPYRISPLGAHIDHQYGKINGLAIDKGIHMAYHPKQNGVVELQSLNFPKRAQFFVSAVPDEKQGDWADHLRGAAKMLGEKYRLKVGLSGIIEGSLPIGGLSSSASVIICFLSALCKVNGIHLKRMEMILTAKAAENQYVGVSCGKLDQSCEVLSKKNHLLYLDTKDDSYELIPTSEKMKLYKVAIFFSGLERSLKNSKYNLRQDECKAAAYALMGYAGMDYDTFANTRLRDVPYEVFEAYKDRLPELWRRRAEHYYSEFARAEKGAELWRKGDLEGYGQLVFESGKSSIYSYECGCDELKKLYEIMVDKNTEDGVSMVLVNTSNGMNLMNQIREQIVLTKQDIVERFGQQHTDYQYPQYYEESIDMLVNEKVELQSIINLYETVFDRIIKKIKKVAKEMLRR